jgi:hypothetical protein
MKNLGVYKQKNFFFAVYSVCGAVGGGNLTPIGANSSPPKISKEGIRCPDL